MKVIKNLLGVLVVFVIIFGCNSEDDSTIEFSGEDFVRFSLILDANNNPYEFPVLPQPSFPEVSEYTKEDLRVLKIPVSLTTTRNLQDVIVSFNYSLSGNLGQSDISIQPSDGQLNFGGTVLTDTIYLRQNSRIFSNNSGAVILKLAETSDPNIRMGYDREINPLDHLEINFGPTSETTYSFEKNREEIIGENGETLDFKVLFPQGFVTDDVDGQTIFSVTSPFDLSIIQKPIENNLEVTYTATINETLPEDSSFDTLFNLVDLNGYTQGNISCFQVSKPIQIERSGNPAVNYYNTADPFFRLRGDYWRVDNEDPNACEWFSHNIFSVPVIVENDDPNGIQVAGMDTPETTDDVYHHRYKIGFVSPNAPIGTNPFALRNLLEGESVTSPGFNLTEAIEFFPENGNSETAGTIAVISQKAIVIRSADGVSFDIPLSGSGTYQLIDEATDLWRLDIEVTYDFSSINGTVHSLPIVLYNQPGQPDPDLSPSSCFEPITL